MVGAVVMRSAGCIYNDIVDRPFDGKVERTKNRPMVREKHPASLKLAVVFLVFNLLTGFVCLLQFNWITVLIGFCTAALIAVYPWMKRITYWPQLFLGLTMNMGFLIGFFALNDSISLGHLLIYIGMVSWTLGYDTIYGFQDMDDDALIGVKSSTFKIKAHPRLYVLIMYATSVLLWVYAGGYLGLPNEYYIFIASITLFFTWQATTLNIKDHRNCLTRFKFNQWTGLLLWLSFIVAC